MKYNEKVVNEMIEIFEKNSVSKSDSLQYLADISTSICIILSDYQMEMFESLVRGYIDVVEKFSEIKKKHIPMVSLTRHLSE